MKPDRCPVCEYPSEDTLPEICGNCHSDLSALKLVTRLGESSIAERRNRGRALIVVAASATFIVAVLLLSQLSLRKSNNQLARESVVQTVRIAEALTKFDTADHQLQTEREAHNNDVRRLRYRFERAQLTARRREHRLRGMIGDLRQDCRMARGESNVAPTLPPK